MNFTPADARVNCTPDGHGIKRLLQGGDIALRAVQLCREATPSKHRATCGSGCGLRRERHPRTSINCSVAAQDHVSKATDRFPSDREAQRKVVLIDWAHSVTGLIVRADPGLCFWPRYPRFSFGSARKAGNIPVRQPRIVCEQTPLATFAGKHGVERDPWKL